MEEQDKEPEEDTTRKQKINRSIEKIRNMPQKQKGEHPGTKTTATTSRKPTGDN